MHSHSYISEVTITENKRLQKIIHEASQAFDKFNPEFRENAYQDFNQYLPVLNRYQEQVYNYLGHVLRAPGNSAVMTGYGNFTFCLHQCTDRNGSLSELEKLFYKLVSLTAKATIDVLKDLNQNEIADLNQRIEKLELNQQQAKAGRDNPRSTLFQA